MRTAVASAPVCRETRRRRRPPFASLASAAQARVILARGERDPMVSFEELRTHARAVLELIEVLLSAD
jgi:hypothetical protein